MLERLGAALRAADPHAAVSTLDEEVILRVAVHDEPFRGEPAARAILTVVLSGPLHDIVPATRLTATPAGEAPDAAIEILPFRTGVAGYPGRADGLLLARSAPSGRIGDLTVFLRPLAALAALADEMGRRMGGPRPAPAR